MSGSNYLLQDHFLKEFFVSPASKGYYLTGGTALARFYLHHRESVDLDFFTGDQKAVLADLVPVVREITRKMNLKLVKEIVLETFVQFIFTGKDKTTLKTDFVRDVPVHFGKILQKKGTRVDSLENIAVNKILAVFGRLEGKDFVDLYFLLTKKKFNLEDLFEKAKKKDLGFTEFYFANSVAQVEQLQSEPKILVPFNKKEFKKFYQDLSRDLLLKIKPNK